ncbi:hypothetical protein [Streptosporangium sp. NPDC049046]|uniref:hypothetical protein n=1 Tax=Streptosporangium sp. NPDC049046 TaxID=3155031 RepID=UPI00341FE3D6
MQVPRALMPAILTSGSIGMVGVAPAAADPTPASSTAAVEDELLGKLTAIPGLTVVSETRPTGYRFFVGRASESLPHDDMLPTRGKR